MRLWLVTCPDDFAGEYDDIEEMFKRGLTRLILDKRSRIQPATDTANFTRATADEYERWLMSLPMEYRDRIWLRGTPNDAEQLDVRGCVCEARSLTGNVPESWKRINCVAHCKSLDEVRALPEWVSGALLGPIFQPLSAFEPVPTLYASVATDNPQKLPNIIAWGGIEPETLPELKKLQIANNIAGVACLGGIWNYADPINAFIKLNRALDPRF